MNEPKKFGFYRISNESNKRLIELFEANQKIRYSSSDEDWGNKGFVRRLTKEEGKARKEVLKMLANGGVRTADDFYRAAFFFHHGKNFQSYALAIALAVVSHHLGEQWGKNLYALAVDRFLLSINQPQYFGTQFRLEKGKWRVSPYNKKTTDKERRKYFVEPIKKALKRINENS